MKTNFVAAGVLLIIIGLLPLVGLSYSLVGAESRIIVFYQFSDASHCRVPPVCVVDAVDSNLFRCYASSVSEVQEWYGYLTTSSNSYGGCSHLITSIEAHSPSFSTQEEINQWVSDSKPPSTGSVVYYPAGNQYYFKWIPSAVVIYPASPMPSISPSTGPIPGIPSNLPLNLGWLSWAFIAGGVVVGGYGLTKK